ncbi:ABC transporter substrate-binding protein [Phytoactinopolyspora alkaliphila]|uniref:ABC transporter substrate-binding protein n=1 Tax=Phytoactinopolyspora alkaliphila TaxID=1783498 RepID=A0A6N9YL11_9ACTN|nr:ABC transporter substrate-binding protein [Phytoactinopolyspora alkaliphila]NED95538.1 ABC transporter substrate-binding protein [Phytoactinopolyspora alkaliphila]
MAVSARADARSGRIRALPLLVSAALAVAGCGSDGDPAAGAVRAAGDSSDTSADDAAQASAEWPVTVENCGTQLTFDAPPERVVTLNRPATEILLALGLRDRITAVAGAPDESADPSVTDDFHALDVLVEKDYPSAEALLNTEPDFLYSAYPSAFRDTGIGSRETFHELGIPTFLSHGRCENRDESQPLTIEEIWSEIEQMGEVFGVQDRAAEFVEGQREQLAQTLASLENLPPMSVFWWDMKTDTPFVGGCCGAPGMIIDAVGFENAFADLPGHWADASWEQVVERDPDLIVIADFGDGDLDTKLDFINSDPTLSQLRAVREGAIVPLPFHSTVPGIQTVTTVGVLADAARELADE